MRKSTVRSTVGLDYFDKLHPVSQRLSLLYMYFRNIEGELPDGAIKLPKFKLSNCLHVFDAKTRKKLLRFDR